MLIDIVIDFYKRHDLWPLVAWGLEQNADHINRVYVVNDDRWELDEIDQLSDHLDQVVMIPLDHERRGITPQRSIRQGANEVNTEYFAHIDSDIVLAPGSIAHNLALAEPEFIVYGEVPDVDKGVTLDKFPDPPIARRDWRLDVDDTAYDRWRMCRDSYWIMRTQDYLDLDGGHDITFPGYGCVDYDFACRWMMKHGLESWMIGPGIAYHVGGNERKHETDPVNMSKFTDTLTKYIDAIEKQLITT